MKMKARSMKTYLEGAAVGSLHCRDYNEDEGPLQMKTPSSGSLIAKTLQGHADVYLIDPKEYYEIS
ncbi:hypothetical protein OROGR_024667 [Orobanche gracilis]